MCAGGVCVTVLLLGSVCLSVCVLEVSVCDCVTGRVSLFESCMLGCLCATVLLLGSV